MTAGSILTPQIIPLRISSSRAKHEIDTNTLVEMKSDTRDVTIHFTIDGSKPQYFKKFDYRHHNTFKYKEPITLPPGKITIKALAVTKDYRESAIVTKVFVVEHATSDPHDLDKDENFLNCLTRKIESELPDLKLRKKEVNMESESSWNGAAHKLTGLWNEKTSLSLHVDGPYSLKKYLNVSNIRQESNSAGLISQSQDAVLCFACGAENPLHIKECMICESKLSEAQMNINFRIKQQSIISLPISRPDTEEKKDQGTQTVGLFYPSHKYLEKKESEAFLQKEKQIKTNNHKSLLTAISPGRGYWRKQLDHVCAHLRSYTQNNMEFRTLIGEPQMGKLISATVHKDGYQVSLQINYALAKKASINTLPFQISGFFVLLEGGVGPLQCICLLIIALLCIPFGDLSFWWEGSCLPGNVFA
ncbi:double zinc ribbon and ankyrin repeat-containing protein 1 isoform X2 [Crotalus tigris]|uniref:double zinc ribbon and ankyrin repeat-containing protein 1 isoform X2 n=1 Tax=Crotalus tigris TaxID=88082 RepID=UPI00192F9417|nr:double zinc ribbon and ankyrin repeat-containing protein 1 isoform X2 [Crotalus tigris]